MKRRRGGATCVRETRRLGERAQARRHCRSRFSPGQAQLHEVPCILHGAGVPVPAREPSRRRDAAPRDSHPVSLASLDPPVGINADIQSYRTDRSRGAKAEREEMLDVSLTPWSVMMSGHSRIHRRWIRAVDRDRLASRSQDERRVFGSGNRGTARLDTLGPWVLVPLV